MRYLLSALFFVLCLFTSCSGNDSDVVEKPKDPVTKPDNPSKDKEDKSENTPSLVRGFMVAQAQNINKQTLSDAKAWGANVVRLQLTPLTYAYKKGSTYEKELPNYIKVIVDRLEEAKSVGIKVILDLHEAPILINGELPNDKNSVTADFWKKPELRKNLVSFWSTLSQTLSNSSYDNIVWGYDLLNEPSIGWTRVPPEWKSIATECIDSIRQNDKDVWIVYEPVVEINAFNNVEPLADKRVVYSVHFYKPGGFTHQGVLDGIYSSKTMTREEALSKLNINYPGNVYNMYSHTTDYWDKQALIKAMKPFTDFIDKYKVPALIGEFSVISWAPTPSAVTWLQDAISIFEGKNYSWCYHAFREWQGWSLEQPEGTNNFWFAREETPAPSKTETQRAKVIKEAFKKNNQ